MNFMSNKFTYFQTYLICEKLPLFLCKITLLFKQIKNGIFLACSTNILKQEVPKVFLKETIHIL